MKEKYKKMMQNQLNIGVQPQQVVIPLNGTAGAYDSTKYCKCQGQQMSDIFVKCDGDDECPNGGWLHPLCTIDLKDKPKEYLDDLDQWYCEDCRERIEREKEEDEDFNKDNMEESV